jgi:hypothetical protein
MMANYVVLVLIFAMTLLSMSIDMLLRRALRIDGMPTRLSAAPVDPR